MLLLFFVVGANMIRAALFAVLLATASLSAHAQDMESREGIALQNQILDLRAQVEALRNGPAAAGPAPTESSPVPARSQEGVPGAANDVTAALVVRVSTLEEQAREMQGKIDDLTNQLQRQHDEFAKQIGDINFKLNPNGTLDGAPGGAPGAGPAAGVAAGAAAAALVPPPPAAPKRTPELAIRAGNAALARRDYAGAVAAATEALQAGPGPRTTDAELLLARGKAGQKNWSEAATGFYSVYKRGPKGPNAPVALLGVANALIGMGKPKDACSALAKLNVEFPHAAAPVHDAAKAARKRAACV